MCLNDNLQIRQEEVKEALWGIKLEKSSGEDDLATEIIKWMAKKGQEWLWTILK